MAKDKQSNINSTSTNTFIKGLNKDSDASFIQEGMWAHARNAVNNTLEGDLGTLSNETSNALCSKVLVNAPVNPLNSIKKIIGAIHLFADKWVIFSSVNSAVNTNFSEYSEIGLFEEDQCNYRVIVEARRCLNFSMYHLITGASRLQEDCSWGVYWSDGNNPDRYLNIGDPKNWPTTDYLGNNYYTNNELWPGVAWEEDCVIDSSAQDEDCYESGQGCTICTKLNTIDCDKIRLARVFKTPCLKVTPGLSGGSLPNGSYMALIAYSIDGQKVTDWFTPSNVQPIFFEEEPFGSIDIEVTADNEAFDEFILCVVSVVNQQTVAKQFGIYSTNTSKITVDIINAELVSIPIEQLPIQTPIFEKSDQMVEVNNYLLRVAPTSKFDFNYQPLANLIESKWVSVEYDADYYVKQGYKPSYLRDEVYGFFIRWVYDTGDKSSSYHIPGRRARTVTEPCSTKNIIECAPIMSQDNHNVIEQAEKLFEVINTGTITSTVTSELEDGGVINAQGDMAYWESKELYPSDKPQIWNSSEHCWTGINPEDGAYDLCGLPIRHHKFPDQTVNSELHHFVNDNGEFKIRILGVKFENIILPKDNNGNDIPGIVGYEILRGSREGNRSIIAKGMLNNMRPYNQIKQGQISVKSLYPNYPFNTVTPINPAPGSAASGTLNSVTTGASSNINDPYIINVELQQSTGIFNPTKFERKSLRKSNMPKNIITFHSPDTSFRNPFIAAKELKVYGYLRGTSEQEFIYPDKHPRHKLMTNGVLVAMVVGGIVNTIVESLGKITFNAPTPIPTGVGGDVAVAGIAGINLGLNAATLTWNTFLETYKGVTAASDVISGSSGFTAAYNAYQLAIQTAAASGFYTPSSLSYSYEGGVSNYFGPILGASTGLQRFYFSFSEGANDAVEIIRNIIPFRQYALQMQAYGFYDEFKPFNSCQHRNRFIIHSSSYLKTNSNLRLKKDAADISYLINNSLRQQSLVLTTKSLAGNSDGPNFIEDIQPTDADQSLITVGTSGADKDVWKSLQEGNGSGIITKTISSHYAAIKVRLRSQYGQLESIRQVPICECEQKISNSNLSLVQIDCGLDEPITQKVITTTPVFFGGDTYINRFTEKNNMLFFNNWLYGEPDGSIRNYFLSQQVPLVRFWANTEPYDVSNLLGGGEAGIASTLLSFLTGGGNNFSGSGALPRQFYKLDNENYNYNFNAVFNLTNPSTYPGLIAVKRSYFYTAVSSVRDFFVESEVIVDHRIAKNLPHEKHYNPYGFNDLRELLNINPDWITRGNSYFYDYSLSISKLFTQYFSQGNLQQRFYDPKVSSQCYTYRPDRIIYSLPQQQESVKDSWFMYLANNYKNFQDEISGVKNFAKTGIFIAFKNASPLILQGVDQLQTDLGTKITIGDGGLFAGQGQNVTIADRPYEYGSSQNRLSMIATPAGMFYASQNQGKIFSFSQNLDEISNKGMKWWFNKFLRYKLLEDFPDYPHTDNPVAGIGIHASYDNNSTVLYFSKRDFELREEFRNILEFVPITGTFQDPRLPDSPNILLGDPRYFKDASWTASYDPKNQHWISFHDWIPNLFLASRGKFYTTKEDGIWKHNDSCQSYCNFYNQDYPFEVEIPVATGQTVNSIRSIEYILECYIRSQANCVDQYHVLDFNFDQAIVYNTEQVSGVLDLINYPKNNPFAAQLYPQFVPAPDRYEILFSKEENKYRFNQFWDITNDRGEFTPVQENIWITEPNGYIKNLNPLNLDYNKPLFERKKFRHYSNFIHLRKEVSGNTNMILKIVNTKKTYSPR
jgi:hypothetical protein